MADVTPPITANAGAGSADTGPSIDDAIGKMRAMFIESVEMNAKISKVQTEGNNAQRAAKGVPQG